MAQTLSGFIANLRISLRFHDTLSTDIIHNTLDRVQRQYEQGTDSQPLPWFNFVYNGTVDTTADQRYVDLPADFVAFDEDWPLTIVDGDGDSQPLIRKPIYFLNAYRDLTGFPESFEHDYTKLHLYPLPDDAYTINLPYFKRSANLSVTSNSPWFELCETLLLAECVDILADALGDRQLLKDNKDKLMAARLEYVRKCEAQKHTLKQYQMGGSDA